MVRRPRFEPLEARRLLAVSTWDGNLGGGGSPKWSNGDNWVGDAVPLAGDDLVFAGSFKTMNQNDLGFDFNSITFNPAPGSDFKISGDPVSLSAGVVNTAGDNDINLDLTVDGAQTFQVEGGSLAVSQDVVLSGDLTLDADSAVLGGEISGDISSSAGPGSPFTLIVNTGTWTLSGTNNTANFETQVNMNATLEASGMKALPDAELLTVNGLLNVLDNETIGPIAGNGTVSIDGSATLTVELLSGDSTFAGTFTGAGELENDGTSALILTGTSDHTGPTTVSGGSLIVDGSLTATSEVTVFGGTLGGSGSITPTALVEVRSGSNLNPGIDAGSAGLSTGSVDLRPGSTYAVDLNGFTAGSGYDQLDVEGTVDLAGSTLDVNLGIGFDPSGGSFVIIDNDGTDLDDAVSGTFSGLAEGASFVVGSTTFVITYQGGDGNDVELITNRPPDAVDDSATTDEDTPVSVDVLTNDSDPDGDPITIISATAPKGTVTIDDMGNLDPADDEVVFDPAGQFEDLNGGQSEIATFEYTIADVHGATDTATVTVTVTGVNDAPVLDLNGAGAGVDHSVLHTSTTGPVNVAAPVQVSDVDNTDLDSATLVITANGTDDDVLTFTPSGGITGSYVVATRTLTLNGSNTSTLADWQATLASVQFDTTNDLATVDTTDRVILVTVTDEGNTSGLNKLSASATTTIVMPPRLVEIVALYGPGASRSYSLTENPDGRIRLPWSTITAFDVVFTEDVDVQAADAVLQGDTTGVTSFDSVSFDTLTNTARFTLLDPLAADAYFLELDGDGSADGNVGIHDNPGGLPGSFLEGGDFAQVVKVLPGDANDNGRIDSQDLDWIVNAAQGVSMFQTDYTDVDGDGDWDLDDYEIARLHVRILVP